MELMELLSLRDCTPLLTIRLYLLKARVALHACHFQEAALICEKLCDKYFGAIFEHSLLPLRVETIALRAEAYLKSEEAVRARTLIVQEVQLFQELRSPLYRARLELLQARVERARGEIMSALTLVDRNMKVLAGGSDEERGEAYLLRGQLALDMTAAVQDKVGREKLARAGLNSVNCALPYLLETGEIESLR